MRAGNTDLAASLARLDAARAELGVVNADRYPKLDFEQTVERRKLSKFDLGEVGEDTANPSTRYSTRLALAYEVDLRGRISAAVRAGRADLKASGGDRDALQLSLARQTAELWLTRAELIADVDLARKTRSCASGCWAASPPSAASAWPAAGNCWNRTARPARPRAS